MKQPLRYLFAAALLAPLLTGCGGKDQAAETSAAAATTAATPSGAPAVTAPAEASAGETTTAPGGTFDISAVPVSAANLGGFPYLDGLQGYVVNTSNSEDFEFERAYVFDGKNLLTVEGKVSQRLFDRSNGAKKASELMIYRNYETLLTELGAVKVFAGTVPREIVDNAGKTVFQYGKWSISTDHETDTYLIRQKDKEVWVQVTALGSDGNYNLTVAERAAMPQQVSTIPADELKKN